MFSLERVRSEASWSSVSLTSFSFLFAVNARGLWKKIGINYDDISTGENSALFSSLEGFTPENRERVERFVEEIYVRFKDCVAKGRKLTPEAAEGASLRVFTGFWLSLPFS